MGWLPATSAYLFAIATAVIAQAVAGSVTITPAGAVRLAISVIGAPLLIVLIRRVETALGDARSARSALEEAHAETARRERALTAAQGELADAYAIAERERARLTEVADPVPEPVIVYDAEGHGRFGNRAARAAFGRAFIECPPEQWHRLVEPRDERGDPIDPGNMPQLIAQREPLRGRYLVRLPTSGRDSPARRGGDAGARGRLRPAAARRRQRGGRAASPVTLRELRGPRAPQPARGGEGPHRARHAGPGARRSARATTATERSTRSRRRSASSSGSSSTRARTAGASRRIGRPSTWGGGRDRRRAPARARRAIASCGSRVPAGTIVPGIGQPRRAGDHEPADERGPLLIGRPADRDRGHRRRPGRAPRHRRRAGRRRRGG